MRIAFLIIALVGASGCAAASAGSASVQQSADAACPLPAEGARFSISVASHSGPPVSLELRKRIAEALASAWGEEERTRIRDWPAFLDVMRELNARLPDQPLYQFNKWRASNADSAVALLTYRKGSVPELDLPQQPMRKDFREWIVKAVGRAIASAINRQALDPLPLQFQGAGDEEVTLEVRFGWSPRPGAAIAEFARQERDVRPRPGNRGPRYPDTYRMQNIEGEVMVGLIIDAAGQVDGSSMRIVWSDGVLFTQSVVAALPLMRFEPLQIECSNHPVVAIQPFNFTLMR